ncbi:MAG: NADH:flavin oxidoreductase/NADH oxidase family protein [Micropepsaceae bacterium]
MLETPLTLPCGSILPNRLCKAAMTEGLADSRNRPTMRHQTLYRRWAANGLGLQISGNIQIERTALERAGNVVLDGQEDDAALTALHAMTNAARRGGGHFWAQINHAGRQTPKAINPNPPAPSAVKPALPGGNFGQPRALAEDEILDLIDRFARAAETCRAHGFTGVQIHAAHGYLVSQFLSPRANIRTDAWGGSLENRARFLLEIVRATRRVVGPDFPISVKLNSADFQKGGFAFEDCLQVVEWLNAERIDLLEISGGTYEQPSMMGLEGMLEPVLDSDKRESTRAREAYFTRYAAAVAKVAQMPLMVTGGFRTRAGMEAALAEGSAHVIGLARPLCGAPDCAGPLLRGQADTLPSFEHQLAMGRGWLGQTSPFSIVRMINGFGALGWCYEQIYRIADGLAPDLKMGVFKAFRAYQATEAKAAKALQR